MMPTTLYLRLFGGVRATRWYRREGAVVDERCLWVPDVLEALQALAAFHRSRYKRRLVALTGSNGKTTTKELIRCVLQRKYIVRATEGNYNNEVGVPLTLLGIYPQVEVAVVELGTSHPGEISKLCHWTRPTHGLITNISSAHMGGFDSFEAVRKEKMVLHAEVCEHNGIYFLSTAEDSLRGVPRGDSVRTYPGVKDDYPVQRVSSEDIFVKYRVGEHMGTSHLWGAHQFNNVATAVAVGLHFGVSPEDIVAAISGYVPKNNRSQCLERGSNIWLLDAYNANLASMCCAVRSLYTTKIQKKKVMVLGDMADLGRFTESHHKELGHYIQAQEAAYGSVEQVLLCGEHMRHTHHVLSDMPHVMYFPSKRSCQAHMAEQDWQHTFILLKGSRCMSMEDLVRGE